MTNAPEQGSKNPDPIGDDVIARRQRDLESIHLPATDHDDPRLAIPDVLKDSNHPRRESRSDTSEQGVAASLAGAGKAWAIAFEFVLTVLAGIGLGWLFDRWKSTTPIGALVGMAAGFIMAFYRIVRATQAQDRAEAKQRQNRR
jgi:F0F1-type ATP synthase assembly protein I